MSTNSLTLNSRSTFSQSPVEQRGDNGKGRTIDFTNPDGGRETLDGIGNGSRIGHTFYERGDERLDIGVGKHVAEGDTGLEGSG